jgi:dipeptidyl aminopeptidase/acylaminoacyl peptidase
VDPREVLSRTADAADAVVRYADHADGVIDLHLPPAFGDTGRDQRPLVVLLHGGFWRAAFDRVHTRPLANALAAEGFVVATPEYRRVGGPGDRAGGWPTTAQDVAAAVGALPGLLDGLGIPIGTTTLLGHSAGGHLALWLANEPLPVDRVVGLAPVGDLRAAAAAHLGDDAAPALLGGEPGDVPERYDAADPVTRFANRPACEVVIVHGVDDDIVPVANSRGLHAAHPWTVLCELDGVEHYGLIDPLSAAWPAVLHAVTG